MTIHQQLLAGSCGAIALVIGISAFGTQDEARVPFSASSSITGEQSGPAGMIPAASVSALIQSRISPAPVSGEAHEVEHGDPIRTALHETYAIRIYDPIWSRDGAEQLVARLEHCRDAGVNVEAGLIEQVEAAANALNGSAAERAEADIFLSQVFLNLANRERNGIDPTLVAMEGRVEAVNPQPLSEQLAYAGEGEFDYRGLDPRHGEFQSLLEARAQYVAYAEAGGFTPMPEVDEALEVGDVDPVIATLRQRLQEEGYDVEQNALGSVAFFTQPTAENTGEAELETLEQFTTSEFEFTPELELALIEFQENNGLEPDGVLGNNTVAALNVTAEEKITRIDANIERWRWAPPTWGENYVRVNIPAYRAEGYENGRETIEMRAIVGMTSRQTPIFQDSIEYVVANPNWYVPENILTADKLDDIRSDPSYISSHNFYVLDRATGEAVSEYDIDWHEPGVQNHYRLVQRPGAGNALGPVKIMFPNEHAVYLHGTPGEQLFARSRRAFSSGCIRLERPEEMARWVLRAGNSADSIDGIDNAWATRQNARFNLENPVPVYMTYFTVEVDDDGDVVFHEDIYNRDQPVIQALSTRQFGLSAIREA